MCPFWMLLYKYGADCCGIYTSRLWSLNFDVSCKDNTEQNYRMDDSYLCVFQCMSDTELPDIFFHLSSESNAKTEFMLIFSHELYVIYYSIVLFVYV